QLQEQAELYESASSAKKARRLVKLLIEVEKGLNSAEAAEIASQSDPARAARYMEDAGLRFLPEPPPPPPPPAQPSSSEGEDSPPSSRAGAENGGSGDSSPPHEKEVAEAATSPRSRREKPPSSSSSRANPGGRTEAAAGKTAAERRRASSANVGRRGTTSNSSGGGGGRKKKRKTKKRRGSEELAAGKPLEAFVVEAAGCEVRCLLMLDEKEGEGREGGRLVVAVGDALTGEALLQSLIEEPAVVQLASYGLMREVAYVNRVAFQSACDILELAGPFIKASVEPGGAFEGYPVHCAGHSFGGAVAACLSGLLEGAIDVEASGGSGGGGRNGGGGIGGESRRGPAGEGKQRQGVESERASRNRRKARGLSDESGEGGDGAADGSGAVRTTGAAPW
ncbi:unnamed protein product, partial [Hapterophycus canaliculatus]